MAAAEDDAASSAPSNFEITTRVARYAYDRLSFAGPVHAVAIGTAAVASIGALEGSLYLAPQHSASWLVKARFVSRYALYNVIPSLIWGTQTPSAIVASSSYLSNAMKPAHGWLYNVSKELAMPPKRVLWVKILCAMRGAVAGSVVLSNVIALTSLWQRASEDYAKRIQLGREPPLAIASSGEALDGCTIRLAGVHSDVTELSLYRRGQDHLWPIFEQPDQVRRLVARYGGRDGDVLPQVPVYWQVNDGEYSKSSSWDGMCIPRFWLYTVINENEQKEQLLYLEADATSGGESALSLQKLSNSKAAEVSDQLDIPNRHWRRRFLRRILRDRRADFDAGFDEAGTVYFDLDLKEIAQGFRRLTDIANKDSCIQVKVVRVLLVDPTVVIASGGGRQTTVREYVDELHLADVVVDARGLVLKSILKWLRNAETSEGGPESLNHSKLKPVILETPSKAWFQSIRSELRQHGYDVIDRSKAVTGKNQAERAPPMLVYERSSADTVNTIRQYVDRGIVEDPSKVCALLTCYEGLGEVETLNKTLDTPVGYVCSSDIHDRALEWVRQQCIKGVHVSNIQDELDSLQSS